MIERRLTQGGAGPVRVQRQANGGQRIVGYGAVYYDGTPGTEYLLWAGTFERIMPGAFDRTIREDDIRGLFNHDPDNLLGRNTAGTMRLSADARGLRYEIDPGASGVARDVRDMSARGDLTGSSFSFSIDEDGENWYEERGPDGQLIVVRAVVAVTVYDTGPVTYPAYTATSVGLEAASDTVLGRYLAQQRGLADAQRRRRAVALQINRKLAAIGAAA